jgi:hypothetical protein
MRSIRRSRAPLIRALPFSVVIAVTGSLDRPLRGFATGQQYRFGGLL